MAFDPITIAQGEAGLLAYLYIPLPEEDGGGMLDLTGWMGVLRATSSDAEFETQLPAYLADLGVPWVITAEQSATPGVYEVVATLTAPDGLQVETITGQLVIDALSAVEGIVPGETTLGSIRLLAKQRADMEQSEFVSGSEWNAYINGSYGRLYDLLVQKFGDDYFAAEPYVFTADGATDRFALPNGSTAFLGEDGVTPARAFLKLRALDVEAPGTESGWAALRRFNLSERNRGGAFTSSYLGARRYRYRLEGDRLWITPKPSAGQKFRLLYIPRRRRLIVDSDVLDGISGWEELVVVDAARKALLKEESDTAGVEREIIDLERRIEQAAENRDAGEAKRVTDVYANDTGDGWEDLGG
jgi:hypothetical protein